MLAAATALALVTACVAGPEVAWPPAPAGLGDLAGEIVHAGYDDELSIEVAEGGMWPDWCCRLIPSTPTR